MVNWVTDVLTPAVTIAVIVFIIFFLAFILWKILTWTIPNFRWKFKYHVLKRKYHDSDIEYCLKALDRNMTEVDLKKHLLIKGVPKKRIEEALFIFNEVKEVKGGNLTDGGQKITRKDKSAFPEI